MTIFKSLEDKYKKKEPYGWIQWKGTDVCIDIHCKCGKFTHFDGAFMYFVQCPYCNQIYEASGLIDLIERDIKDLKDCSIKKAERDDFNG